MRDFDPRVLDRKRLELQQIFQENPNQRDDDGTTPLWQACYYGLPEWVSKLLEAGADPQGHKVRADQYNLSIWTNLPKQALSKPKGKSTLLHAVAAGAGSARVAEQLIDAGISVDEPDAFGSTPLHLAAHNRCRELVEALLRRKADPNAFDRVGYSAIDHAGQATVIVKALLDAGASPDGGPKIPRGGMKQGWSALTTAAAEGWHSVVDLLLAAGAKPDKHPDALLQAAKAGQTRALRSLLEAGADVDHTLKVKGKTYRALEVAALFAWVPAVRALIPQCRHQLDQALQTAVAFAGDDQKANNNRRGDRVQILDLLLKAGASPGAALFEAAVQEDSSYVDRLLEAGADINTRSPDGETLLHLAAAQGNVEQTRTLLEAGADPLAEDAEGRTPFARALIAYQKDGIDEARMVMHALRDKGGAPEEKQEEPQIVGMAVGAKVESKAFGQGEVLEVMGEGDLAKIKVNFEDAGEKVIQARFLTLK